jgi:hypothetical protein
MSDRCDIPFTAEPYRHRHTDILVTSSLDKRLGFNTPRDVQVMVVFDIEDDEVAVVLADLIRILDERTSGVTKLGELSESVYLR